MGEQNYLNNDEFIRELELSHEKGEPTENLHIMFFELAKNIARKYNYAKLPYSDDLIMEGYMKCIKVFRSFNMEKTNPFAYFTSVIENRMRDYIKKENKQKDLIIKSLNEYKEEMKQEYGIDVNLNDGWEK